MKLSRVGFAHAALFAGLFATGMWAADATPGRPAMESDLAPLGSYESTSMVARGQSPEKVHAVLGAPNRELGTNAWIYWDYSSDLPGDPKRFNTLVVLFRNGAVVGLRLVGRKEVEQLIARWEATRAKAAAMPGE